MSVAYTYAKALYEAAADQKMNREGMSQLESELDNFAQAIEKSKDARLVLFGPLASSKEKEAVVQALSKSAGFTELTTRFLSLVAAKERLSLIREIRDAFSSVRLNAEGGIAGKVVVAEPIEQSDIDDLANAFGKKLGKPVAFQVSTDATLLAGMKVTVGGVTYDGSLRSQLQRLRDRFIAGFQA